MDIENKLKKIIPTTLIPHEFISSIYDEINGIEKMKSENRKEKKIKKSIKEIFDELNEASSIADEVLNDTKNENKKKKILLFIEYNNKRINIFNQYLNTGQYDTNMNININEFEKKKKTKEPKICPEGKILNPKTGRCIKIKPEKKTTPKPKEAKPKECPEGKILNPKTNRCIKKKQEKDPNEPPKKRGRPKKKLIIDINEPKEEKRTKLERELIKLLPKISPSYFYDIDKVIKEIDESNYSINLKMDRIKEIINDLNDISFDVIERKNEATEKKKNDYMKFIKYHNNRRDKVDEYLKQLLIEYKRIWKLKN